MNRTRGFALIAVALVWVAAGLLAFASSRKCAEARGTFHWSTLSCEGGGPPLILQRDLSRT